MRAVGSRIYQIILGTFPVIDLPRAGGRMVLGPREGLAADLRLSSPSSEILDFGAYDEAASGAHIPLKNHSPSPERLRLSGETGRAMLLGHRNDIHYKEERPSGGPKPENAGGLF
jgi:hypothetical protein